MMDGIKKDEFTHLLVFSSDRIARNMVDFIEVLNILKKHHVSMYKRYGTELLKKSVVSTFLVDTTTDI